MAPAASEADIIKTLEKRIADLEGRVRKLESSGRTAAKADPCPKCGGPLKITDEHSHPAFGLMGLKVRVFTCADCGRTVECDYDPGKG